MRRPKKHKASSESPPPDLESAVDLLINDASLPAHLRVVIGHLLGIKKDYSNVLARNQELLDEIKDAHQKNTELQQENEGLRSEIVALKSQLSVRFPSTPQNASASANVCCCDETERKRSIVIEKVS
ncbi:unnamed protein product [Nippostrongylus brasiliensis]|uniref:Uncharacterized protein n=1 Tax=Nippostrongylus brasiliensis TaxID=27835 RepID=A0A0N4XWI9_NIPBR|nr:unnamed protein product [Nippostrongylus brasiliensis]